MPSTSSVSSMPVRSKTLWSRRVHCVMAKESLCSKVVIRDYYRCCVGYRLERCGWSYCGAHLNMLFQSRHLPMIAAPSREQAAVRTSHRPHANAPRDNEYIHEEGQE